jgi:hypothetical protein
MKTRQGFVSNSSSSSFVLVSVPTRKTYISITREMEDIGTRIDTKVELDKYYLEFSGCSDMDEVMEDDWLGRQYRACVNALSQGNVVWLCEVCSDTGDAFQSALYNCGNEVVYITKENPHLKGLSDYEV